MAAGTDDVVTLDSATGGGLGLSGADLALLTETGLPRDAGGYFRTDIPDGPLGLFAVLPLNEDNRALILGGAGSDGDMLYFLDVNEGVVVLFSPGEGDEEPQFEMVNTSLRSFAEFARRLGAYVRAPWAGRPADDKARLAEIAAGLRELDPEAFAHPHCWWAMVVARLRREVARRERAHSPAGSHSEAFERALDRLEERGWRHVTGKEFASATDEYGLLALPEDFSGAFSADGAQLRDVDVRWRGGLPAEIQSVFAREGLVVRVPEGEPVDEDEDYDAAMERLLAAVQETRGPDEGTVTCPVPTETSDLCRIVRAFDHLTAKGYVAEPALWPTTSGCWERVAEQSGSAESLRAVFWNTQSHDDAFDTRGDLVGELYLGWAGDREEIAAALAETELTVRTPEDEGTTFILAPPTAGPEPRGSAILG